MSEKTKTSDYQVLARKYRPQTFQEVLGQEAIVTTLKNGIKQNRLAHAYLFSGSRGTGKTTLARLLAKALNCQHPSSELEPCNSCPSCREITSGQSLDVIEIDGASNRGIDEIRQINETVGYASASGKYKIYIIDEVHMLTKEAFNALLKTLEEPPASVKFFFATTEPHKVLPTILSRCQRFNLRRLSIPAIVDKLATIAEKENRTVAPEVLTAVATRAEGGLRDAESLFDQLLSFYEGPINALQASEALGTLPQEIFFQLDQAGKDGQLAIAFTIAAQIFNEGKDLSYFVQMLTEHFRHLTLCKVDPSLLEMSGELRQKYQVASALYHKEQLLGLIELCLSVESTIRFAPSPRIVLEGLLLKILRSHSKIPLDQLVNRLVELEKRVVEAPTLPAAIATPKIKEPEPTFADLLTKPNESKIVEKKIVVEAVAMETTSEKRLASLMPTPPASTVSQQPEAKSVAETKQTSKTLVEPTAKPVMESKQPSNAKPAAEPPAKPMGIPVASPHYDTILQFAAVELEGRIIKK